MCSALGGPQSLWYRHMKLDEIKAGLSLSGVEPTQIVSVVATVPQGNGADVAALGRLLRLYGPEANGAHEALRMAVERALVNTWPQQRTEKSRFSPEEAPLEEVYVQLRNLVPKDDEHRMMKSEALSLLKSLALMRWLVLEQTSTTVLRPLLFVMIFCLTAIFVSWGLFSPLNATTGTTFFVAALCVSGAILLVLELYSPYSGLLRLSSEPLHLAYESLKQ